MKKSSIPLYKQIIIFLKIRSIWTKIHVFKNKFCDHSKFLLKIWLLIISETKQDKL